ncbi:hypothetical protein G6O69_30600 [Pseudenhygromyxa sp. WMMC2535]|uniref:hypothetical protein n=1 Tax=Pseudenhygromyxa sp. WMMC2535 TaxID=2712867 RepID=UPI0015558623|nr:hypothetical protein [Pseudenhygromyxa sp. WMMC2535]NVB42213.1 hypothetical protein [Pseudenhygromyxa sp. WMMC2535]
MNDPRRTPISSPPWFDRLASLEAQRRALGESFSLWQIESMIHPWVERWLGAAAIRVGSSEGLVGRPPARWRLWLEVDESTRSYALAVLPGDAPTRAANVVASLMVSAGQSDRARVAIAVREGGLRWIGDQPDAGDSRSARVAVTKAPNIPALLDVLDGHRVGLAGDLSTLAKPIELATSLASSESGGALLLGAQPSRRHGHRQPRLFVVARDASEAASTLRMLEDAGTKASPLLPELEDTKLIEASVAAP